VAAGKMPALPTQAVPQLALVADWDFATRSARISANFFIRSLIALIVSAWFGIRSTSV
jgi:hypothetical protein